MTTQKDVLRIFKTTKNNLAVITFLDGKRQSSYSGLDMIQALKEVALQNSHSPERLCLIVDSRTAPCAKWDIKEYVPHVVSFSLFI